MLAVTAVISLKTTELSMNLDKDPEFTDSRQVSRMPTLVWVPPKRPWVKSLGWSVSCGIANSSTGAQVRHGQVHGSVMNCKLRSKKSQWCSWHGAITLRTQFPHNMLRYEQCVSKCPHRGRWQGIFFLALIFSLWRLSLDIQSPKSSCTLQAVVHQKTFL